MTSNDARLEIRETPTAIGDAGHDVRELADRPWIPRGGPPSRLLVGEQCRHRRAVEAIAFPGLTARIDVAESAALAITLLDWKVHGPAYATEMRRSAAR